MSSPKQADRWHNWHTGIGWALVAIGGVVIWKLASIWVFVIPSPVQTAHAFVQIGKGGELASAAQATAANSILAFAAAVVCGTLVGAAVGRSDYWYKVLSPFVVVSASIPKLIVYPVLLLLLGLGGASVTSMGFIGGIFPVLINVMVGVRNIKPVYIKVGRTLKISPWQALVQIYIPAVALPLLAGVRLSFGLTLVNVIIAELFAAKVGVGRLIMTYYNLGQYPDMMALMLSFFVVAMGGSILLWLLERRLRRAEGVPA